MVTLESCSILFCRILRCYVEMLNTTQLCNSAVFRFPRFHSRVPGFQLWAQQNTARTGNHHWENPHQNHRAPDRKTSFSRRFLQSLKFEQHVANLGEAISRSQVPYNAISARAIVALCDFPGLIVRNPTRIQRPGIWMDLGHFSPQLICNKHQPARSGRSTVVKIPAAWVIWGVSWHSWHSWHLQAEFTHWNFTHVDEQLISASLDTD